MVSLAGGEAIQQTAGLVSKVKIQEPTKSGQPQPMRAIKSVWLWSFGYLLEPTIDWHRLARIRLID